MRILKKCKSNIKKDLEKKTVAVQIFVYGNKNVLVKATKGVMMDVVEAIPRRRKQMST